MAYEKICVFFLLMLGFLSGSMATEHQVGEAYGWNTRSNYHSWASTKDFRVGDVIVFSYNPQFHDVYQVSKEDYDACSSRAPLAIYDTGNDAIMLTTPGRFYYICTRPGMCQAGQKLEINVKSNFQTLPPPNSFFPPLTTNPPPPPPYNGPLNNWYGLNRSASMPAYSRNLGLVMVFASFVLVFLLH